MSDVTQFRPNQRVPLSGVYRVNHHKHRLVHEATLLANEKFPCCRQCGKAVKFMLVRVVDDKNIHHFSSGLTLEQCD
jgi:hypothetical protein